MLNKFNFKAGIIFFLVLIPVVAFSQELEQPVPLQTVFEAIATLVKNWKGMSGIGIAAAILTLLVQILKTELLGGLLAKASPFLKRLLITVLGQFAGIVIAVNGGLGWIEAVVAGLLTSGGAVAIYEAIKPFFSKKS